MSPLQETSKDPFSGDCSCRQDGLTVIITACLTFATGVTVALIMQIYFGDPQVRPNSAFMVGLCLQRGESSLTSLLVSSSARGILGSHGWCP